MTDEHDLGCHGMQRGQGPTHGLKYVSKVSMRSKDVRFGARCYQTAPGKQRLAYGKTPSCYCRLRFQ